MSLPPLPPGARLLSADEAVDLLVVGDHPEASAGSVAQDAALVEAIRTGQVVACQLADGRISFTRPPLIPPTSQTRTRDHSHALRPALPGRATVSSHLL